MDVFGWIERKGFFDDVYSGMNFCAEMALLILTIVTAPLMFPFWCLGRLHSRVRSANVERVIAERQDIYARLWRDDDI